MPVQLRPPPTPDHVNDAGHCRNGSLSRHQQHSAVPRWRAARTSVWHARGMAVFTEVSLAEAQALFKRLDTGELTRLIGITSGIENTNYFAETSSAHYVVTLFERMSRDELPFYLQLMTHLARRGLPVPDPRSDASGELIHEIAGKPAIVVNRLRGAPQLAPTQTHCNDVARILARMHVAVTDFQWTQPNPRGLAWWTKATTVLSPLVTPAQRELLHSELEFQSQFSTTAAYAALPRGAIHADLFRDNLLFESDRLSGVLDFYFAGVDALSFDIAVCLNDWCSDPNTGDLLEQRASRFIEVYAAVRAIDASERKLMSSMLRAAALRFWISRLYDLHVPRTAALLQPRDPSQFERVLRARIARPWIPAPVR